MRRGNLIIGGLIVLCLLVFSWKNSNHHIYDSTGSSQTKDKSDAAPMPSPAPTNETAQVPEENKLEAIGIMGDMFARKAILMDAKDPGSVKFGDKIGENFYPGTGVYWAKYQITANNGYGTEVSAIGVGTVKYSGGDISKPDNWEIMWGRITNE